MGSCLSKKSTCASSSSSPVTVPKPPENLKSEKKKAEVETVVKKEIFIIKHRKSHEVEKTEEIVEKGKDVKLEAGVRNGGGIVGGGGGGEGGGGAAVRTSSCTKEEVDAILIQCGRLSRSSSAGKAALSTENGGKKYSGSKRSYDFDNENGKSDNVNDGDDDAVATERENRRRERRHHSQGRRRTPSRERERDQAAAQRSGSRERGGSSGGGRRVSRSPGRRSESPITTTCSNTNSNSSAGNNNSRPGKMVSVPATVTSLGGGEPNTTSSSAVKRIQVKRNVGGDGTRSAASPRARSPARVRASNENSNQNQQQQQQQQPLSLSRSNSRKAEHSPFRRNPLSEIDTNIISQAPIQKPNAEIKTVQTADNRMNSSNLTPVNCKNHEQQQISGHVGLNVISENLKVNTVTRSRSSRLSRDLDINPETLLNPPDASYTALLLEDIHNFHQKNTPPPAAFSLPPCVTKACSILEAVADLNSSTGSNLSTTFSEDHKRKPTELINNKQQQPSSTVRKMKSEIKDPILESEVIADDDLMQPSFHKYVTVRRGTTEGGEDLDLEEQESSGSNSFAGSGQQWLSSSCWEPNSAESTDRCTSSSRSVSRQTNLSPLGVADEGGKRASGMKRDADHQQNGIGRARIKIRSSHITSATAVASS